MVLRNERCNAFDNKIIMMVKYSDKLPIEICHFEGLDSTKCFAPVVKSTIRHHAERNLDLYGRDALRSGL